MGRPGRNGTCSGSDGAIASSAPLTLRIPDPSLVLLVGASGAGKSTFARRHFRPTEILSTDFFRALITDDENDQGASGHAYYMLKYIADRRLRRRRLTVIDATNVEHPARRGWVRVAMRHEVPAVAIVLDLPLDLLLARAASHRAPGVAEKQHEELHRSMPSLDREGFEHVFLLQTPAETDSVVLERESAPAERGLAERPG